MREKLKPFVKRRLEFEATVVTFGSYTVGYTRKRRLPSLLLENVCIADTKEQVADYIWVDPRKWARDLEKGDKIKIAARVTPYNKGYHTEERKKDYQLERIKLLANYKAKGKRR